MRLNTTYSVMMMPRYETKYNWYYKDGTLQDGIQLTSQGWQLQVRFPHLSRGLNLKLKTKDLLRFFFRVIGGHLT
jgi:hypothetical protein